MSLTLPLKKPKDMVQSDLDWEQAVKVFDAVRNQHYPVTKLAHDLGVSRTAIYKQLKRVQKQLDLENEAWSLYGRDADDINSEGI